MKSLDGSQANHYAFLLQGIHFGHLLICFTLKRVTAVSAIVCMPLGKKLELLNGLLTLFAVKATEYMQQ